MKDSVRKTEVEVEQLGQKGSRGGPKPGRYDGQERRVQPGAGYRGMDRRGA